MRLRHVSIVGHRMQRLTTLSSKALPPLSSKENRSTMRLVNKEIVLSKEKQV